MILQELGRRDLRPRTPCKREPPRRGFILFPRWALRQRSGYVTQRQTADLTNPCRRLSHLMSLLGEAVLKVGFSIFLDRASSCKAPTAGDWGSSLSPGRPSITCCSKMVTVA
jgi:hypothetical protein